MKKLVIGMFAIFVLAACGGGSSASIQGEWKLVSYNQIPAAPDVDTSIEFKDGQLSGNVGCNNFGGGYSVSGDSITFDPIATTEMFCEGPIGDQELGTYAMLQGSVKFELNGSKLILTSEDGKSVLVLEMK